MPFSKVYETICIPANIQVNMENQYLISLKSKQSWLGTVAHTCNPSTLGGWGGWITRSRDWDHPGHHGETCKNTKINQAWWHMPIVSATREAEAGESLGPRRWRLQWAKIAPLHSSLGNKSETLSQKKKKKNDTKKEWLPFWGCWEKSTAMEDIVLAFMTLT